jgi:hypothetical protein
MIKMAKSEDKDELEEKPGEWGTISFPKYFVDYIKELIKNSYIKKKYPTLRSVSGFALRACEEKAIELEKEIERETGLRPFTSGSPRKPEAKPDPE